ncbi:MAG: hypothetical protein H6832_03825 [Planctomycetes bacterium]|nr:hypothetical protein [Planctomycetota bacterium]
MNDSDIDLTRHGRIEFVGACLFLTTIVTPILTAFLYHAITGQKTGWSAPLVATAIADAIVTLWAMRSRPSRWLVVTMLVGLPTTIALTILVIRAIDLTTKLGSP